MEKVVIQEYEATALGAIPDITSTVRDAFRSNRTKDLQWRHQQLRKLYWAVEDFKPQLVEALKRDLNKSAFESQLAELDFVQNDCLFMTDNLEKFAKDEKIGAPSVPPTFSMLKFRTQKDPMGAVLIIGPYNYPLQLLICPLIGAIGAGCSAVVKPSELAPASAMVIKEMIEMRLDTSAFAVVNGSVPETTALLEEKWDKIFFTGSARVGAIIATKAAQSLTPVCLELGGRNPAFVTKNANIPLTARHLLWAKVQNAGQACLSQNYVLVEKEVVDTLILHLHGALKEIFPDGAKADPDFVRIVNSRHFHRIKKAIDESKGKIVVGGHMDEPELFIEPTVVLVNSMDDSMIKEELFGPVFSIYPVSTLEEGINIANSVFRTPLALFSFGSEAENNKVLRNVISGGATLNDTYFHGSLSSVPFGGVGESGWGSYRGKASFDTFTHFRTVAQTPYWMERFIRVRYMPYNWKELRLLQRLTYKKPSFDRNGQVIRGFSYWTSLVLSLGGKGAKGTFLRWLVVLVLVGLYLEVRYHGCKSE